MAPAAGASGRCWRLLIRCLHSGSSYQPAPVAVTARAFYKMASSMEAGQPLSRVQELRTMPACNVDGGVRWISSIQSPCMEIVTETGREDQDDGENVREGEDRKGQYPGSAAINLEEASLDLQTLNSSASKGAFFFGNDWQLMSTEAQVCSRAMSNLQNSEPYLGSPRYQPHEAKHGNPKGTGAWAAGSVTMSRTFAGQYGGSYLKALLVATNNGRTTTGIRLEYTHSSTYTLADVTMGKPDALYPRVVELGDNKRYRFDKAGLQPAILEMPDRPMHASRIANAWSSCIFHRGGTASIGVSNLLKAQTRSYKTRMANRSIRDQKKRLLVQQYEMKRAHYKAICHDRSLPSQVRYEFGLKLSKLPRNSSKTRLKNRCVFTGRSHSVYRKFGISRIVFRELASRGALTGVNKASW